MTEQTQARIFWRTSGQDRTPATAEDFVVIDGTLYFCADDGVNGRELWRSVGSPAGTYMLADVAPGSGSGFVGTTVSSRLAFTASNAQGGEELWITDGTPDGTTRVTDINPGTTDSSPDQLVVAAHQLFFTATDGPL